MTVLICTYKISTDPESAMAVVMKV